MGPCPFFPSQLGKALNTPSLNTLQGGASLLLSPDLVSAEHETQSDFPSWSSPRCRGSTLCLKCSPGFRFPICSFSSPFSPLLCQMTTYSHLKKQTVLGNLTERVSPREDMESRSLGAEDSSSPGRAGMCKTWGCARCSGVQEAGVCKMLLETVHWELSL